MKTRAKVRLMSYIAAAVAIILGAGIVGYNLANTYKTTIQYSYHRSLSQLSDYFSSIKNTLQKGEYANTQPQQYGLASKLMGVIFVIPNDIFCYWFCKTWPTTV